MKYNGIKYFAIACLWLMMGFVCSLAGIYSFTNGVSQFIKPVTHYLITAAYPQFSLTLADFVLFHAADYFFVVLFAFLLAVATGRKVLWFIAFIIGALAIKFYGLTIYLNQQDKSASFLSSEIQIFISSFLIVPVIAWLGLTLGNKYRTKRQNTAIRST